MGHILRLVLRNWLPKFGSHANSCPIYGNGLLSQRNKEMNGSVEPSNRRNDNNWQDKICFTFAATVAFCPLKGWSGLCSYMKDVNLPALPHSWDPWS